VKDTLVLEDSSAGMKRQKRLTVTVAVRLALNGKHDFLGAPREIESFSEVLGAAAQELALIKSKTPALWASADLI
jgi:hypothetical protein